MPATRSGLSGPGVFEARPELRRTQVRVDAERLPQRQQRVLGTLLARRAVVGRVADGAEQHGVGAEAGVERRLAAARCRTADRRPADRRRVQSNREAMAEAAATASRTGQRAVDDFGPDPVTGQERRCVVVMPCLPRRAPPAEPRRRYTPWP